MGTQPLSSTLGSRIWMNRGETAYEARDTRANTHLQVGRCHCTAETLSRSAIHQRPESRTRNASPGMTTTRWRANTRVRWRFWGQGVRDQVPAGNSSCAPRAKRGCRSATLPHPHLTKRTKRTKRRPSQKTQKAPTSLTPRLKTPPDRWATFSGGHPPCAQRDGGRARFCLQAQTLA